VAPSPSVAPLLTPEQEAPFRAETVRALALPPPAIELELPVPSAGEVPEPGGQLFGPLGVAGGQQVYDAATSALDVMLRTPALLDWRRTRAVADFAPLRRTIHPELIERFDYWVAAFVGSAANGASTSPDTEATLEAVSYLAVIAHLQDSPPSAPVPLASKGQVTGRMAGLGGPGSGAYGALRLLNGGVFNVDPAGQTAAVTIPYELEIKGVDEQGRPQEIQFARTKCVLAMKRHNGKWMIYGFDVGDRTAVATPRA